MSAMIEIEKEKSEYDASPSEGHYPYGTRLELEDELVTKLGLDKLNAGDSVNVRAVALLKRKEEYVDGDDKEGEVDQRVCLQFTSIAVAKTQGSAVKELYPEGES